MHISKEITGSLGSQLAGKKLVLCLSGSVAVLKFMEIARHLMRLGADVIPVLSQAASELVTPTLVHWATGNKPVTALTGKVEHVELAGNVKGKADLILVAPATANTIGKIACGIDDTPVTTVVTTALGEGIPLMVVPAMHLPMYNHPVVKENIAKLKKLGIDFIDPRVEEGKAKLAEEKEIIDRVLAHFKNSSLLKGRRILITAGPTIEYIDPVRVITNRSSGKMGMALASCAMQQGAEVTIIYGPGSAPPPAGARVISVDTSARMHDAVMTQLKKYEYDVVIAAAAVSDWEPVVTQPQKIATGGKDKLRLELRPTTKIVDKIKEASPTSRLVCFKAATSCTDNELIEIATRRMIQASADFIVANDVSRQGTGFDVDTNEVYVIGTGKKPIHLPMAPKSEIARSILKITTSDLTS